MVDVNRPDALRLLDGEVEVGWTRDELLWELCRKDFVEFLGQVQIQDTDPRSGVVEMGFELWPALRGLAVDLVEERLLVVLKARQVGVTWLMVAYMYWLAAYHPGVVCLSKSKGELEAKATLSRLGFIHDRLPVGLRAGVESRTTESWSFGNGSLVQALPATSTAGRSFTASFLLDDEADFHPDLEASIAASRPSVDAGGQHVIVSTANPDNGPDSPFKRRYLKARDGESGYKARFIGWDARPGRDASWFSDVARDYEEDRRKKEYPNTEQEALSAPSTLAGIPPEVLDEMRTRCRQELRRVEGQPPDARVFVGFRPGRRYAAFTDTGHGIGQDYSVTVILECETETVVADVCSNLIEPHELALQSVGLLRMYDSPVWGIEDNEWGKRTIDKAEELGYRELYHRPISHKDPSPGRVGWTTNRANRPLLISELRESCLSQSLTVCAEDGLQQFYDLERKPQEEGRIAAIDGRHDDYPMAVGGALMMKPHARRSKAVVYDPQNNEYHVRTVPAKRRGALSLWRWK